MLPGSLTFLSELEFQQYASRLDFLRFAHDVEFGFRQAGMTNHLPIETLLFAFVVSRGHLTPEHVSEPEDREERVALSQLAF